MAISMREIRKDPKAVRKLDPHFGNRSEFTDGHPMDPAFDEYYEELGNVIERAPICTPRVRRGIQNPQ